ncbi:MAG: histidinol dehydrogenase [Ignavibacteriae bacterium]|nr:MAG: histidinol dehydrogenase [Ignavibacteriota bacterium]
MKSYSENTLTREERLSLLRRPSTRRTDSANVQEVCLAVKQRGDEAVREYTRKFDNAEPSSLRVTAKDWEAAQRQLTQEFKDALTVAIKNIRTFHKSQLQKSRRITTTDGIVCWRETRPIERVGLYVPAGSAPLPSTVLMLGIPAMLAGCSRIVLCSPPKADGSVDPLVLAAAVRIGINEVYNVGGAQAIAAMAYGTESLPKVDKIFGPGNRFVTAAKQFVSNDPDGAAMDLPAGPSEVLILADETADPEVVAYDLLSQAEHDADSQAVLVTTSEKVAKEVLRVLPQKALEFPRNKIVESSLEQSFILVAGSIESAVRFSNDYAPEHLILNMKNAAAVVPSILNAGSVFVGSFAPVTAGDYASGTNHTLPTSGSARWASGVSLDSFVKNVTFQSITKSGLKRLAPTLTTFATVEGLLAHARAVTSRLLK